MSGLTRQHFEAIAKILGKHEVNGLMILDFVIYFKGMNPRFDIERFQDAIDKVRGN